MNTVLLLIDVQRSFQARDYWNEKAIAHWRDRQRALLDLARECEIPIVRVLHEEPESDGPFDPLLGLNCPLAAFDDTADLTIRKQAHNAFTDTPLLSWLTRRGLNRVLVSGIRTEQCCETTTRVASDLGFDVDFVSEATLTFPMTRNGRTWSAEDIRERTELVLADRFARIVDVATLKHEWIGDAERQPA